MFFVALLLPATTGLFYAAASYQNHGHAWADQTCASMQSMCDSPYVVAVGAGVAIVIAFVMRMIRS